MDLVADDGHRNAAPGHGVEQLRDAVIRPCLHLRIAAIVVEIFLQARLDGIGAAVPFGKRPLGEHPRAVADKVPVGIRGMLFKPPFSQHGVEGVGDVGQRVEQGSVQVEDDGRNGECGLFHENRAPFSCETLLEAAVFVGHDLRVVPYVNGTEAVHYIGRGFAFLIKLVGAASGGARMKLQPRIEAGAVSFDQSSKFYGNPVIGVCKPLPPRRPRISPRLAIADRAPRPVVLKAAAAEPQRRLHSHSLPMAMQAASTP